MVGSLRRAFHATMQDGEFRAEAALVANLSALLHHLPLESAITSAL